MGIGLFNIFCLIIVIGLMVTGSVYIIMATKDTDQINDDAKLARKYGIWASVLGIVISGIILVGLGIVIARGPPRLKKSLVTVLLVISLATITACSVLASLSANNYHKIPEQLRSSTVYKRYIIGAILNIVPLAIIVILIVVKIIQATVSKSPKKSNIYAPLKNEKFENMLED